MSEETKTRRIISPSQVLRVVALLEQHIVRSTPETHYYEPGWSDIRTAQEVGEISNFQVSRVRKDLFGEKVARPDEKPLDSNEDLTRTKARIDNIEQFLISLDLGFKL